MEDFPSAFLKLYRTTVASGDKSGKLDQILIKLAEYTEKKQTIRRKIEQALLYPLFKGACFYQYRYFLLTYVVPKIVTVFNQTQQALPLMTLV